MRIARIDAPERGEAGAAEARAALAALIASGEVRCSPIDADPRRSGHQRTDPYGRIVARCQAGGRDLGAQLLAQGHAVPWPRRR